MNDFVSLEAAGIISLDFIDSIDYNKDIRIANPFFSESLTFLIHRRGLRIRRRGGGWPCEECYS